MKITEILAAIGKVKGGFGTSLELFSDYSGSITCHCCGDEILYEFSNETQFRIALEEAKHKYCSVNHRDDLVL
jgi:hypothetical protein